MTHQSKEEILDKESNRQTSSSRGSIYVSVETREKQLKFVSALAKLKKCGWEIDATESQISVIIDSSDTDSTILKLHGRGIKVGGPEIAKGTSVVEPDAYAILNALGGTQLEEKLAKSVEGPHLVDKVIVGLNWTMVRAGELCGIARSPERGTQGARTVRPIGGFSGMPLSQLANSLLSMDSLDRSIGLAAVNAFWNRPCAVNSVLRHFRNTGGLSALEPPGEGVLIVGGFRGAAKRLPSARIVEREPKSGDLSVEEAPKAFLDTKHLAITAQTLMNGSLMPILASSSMVPHRLLVGPSAPLSPTLFDFGINEISGAVVTDPDMAETFILETGTMIMLDHMAESRYMVF